jgi:hypothetical protein
VGELNAIVNIFTAATSSQLVKSPRTDDNKLLQIFFIQLALSLIEIHKITLQFYYLMSQHLGYLGGYILYGWKTEVSLSRLKQNV